MKRKRAKPDSFKPAHEFAEGDWVIIYPCAPMLITGVRCRGNYQLEWTLWRPDGQNAMRRTVGRYRLAGVVNQPPVPPYPFPKVVITVEDRRKRFNGYTLGAVYGIKLIESLPSEFLFKAMDVKWESVEFQQLRNQIGTGTNASWVVAAAADTLYTRGEIDEKQFDALTL